MVKGLGFIKFGQDQKDKQESSDIYTKEKIPKVRVWESESWNNIVRIFDNRNFWGSISGSPKDEWYFD